MSENATETCRCSCSPGTQCSCTGCDCAHHGITEQPTTPQWICIHCYIHLVNGDCTEVDTCTPGSEDEHDPMRLFGDMYVTSGTLSEEHSCGREDGKDVDECDCERNTFSWSACDGYGDSSGGEREAVTGWFAV